MGYVDKADIIAVIAGVESILSDLQYNFTKGIGVSTANTILNQL